MITKMYRYIYKTTDFGVWEVRVRVTNISLLNNLLGFNLKFTPLWFNITLGKTWEESSLRVLMASHSSLVVLQVCPSFSLKCCKTSLVFCAVLSYSILTKLITDSFGNCNVLSQGNFGRTYSKLTSDVIMYYYF